jgi:hypothetical protein
VEKFRPLANFATSSCLCYNEDKLTNHKLVPMPSTEKGISSLPGFIIALVWDFFYFPIWWYGPGFFMLLRQLGSFLVNREKSLALLVWVRNIGKPMYNQHDFWGIIVSFFMRVTMIIFRGLIFLWWSLIALTIVLLWLSLPPVVLYQVAYQFFTRVDFLQDLALIIFSN